MVVGGLAAALALALPAAGPFYFWYVDLSTAARLAAWVGYVLVSGIWVLGVFLSTLKEYAAVTRAFGDRDARRARLPPMAWAPRPASAACWSASTSGWPTSLFALVGRVFAEFPFPVNEPFAFLPYFRHALAAGARRRPCTTPACGWTSG